MDFIRIYMTEEVVKHIGRQIKINEVKTNKLSIAYWD